MDEEGREIFLNFVEKAVVLEKFPPTFIVAYNIGYESVHDRNPSSSTVPFRRTGIEALQNQPRYRHDDSSTQGDIDDPEQGNRSQAECPGGRRVRVVVRFPGHHDDPVSSREN